MILDIGYLFLTTRRYNNVYLRSYIAKSLSFFITICYLHDCWYLQGLFDAFDILMPNTEHRYCLKHLHANVKSNSYKGQVIKDTLWRCAKAATVTIFNQQIENMKGLCEPCHHIYQTSTHRVGLDMHSILTQRMMFS